MTSVGAWLGAHDHLPRLDRELLVCEALGVGRARVLSHPEMPLDPELLNRLGAWAARLAAGEPLAYLTGRREFHGHELQVDRSVLIPRPETELLVEQVLARLPRLPPTNRPRRVLDLGTGSGAIAIAIALADADDARPDAPAPRRPEVTGSDHSAAALRVARQNAERLGAPVRWVASDWFGAIDGRYDIVVSNPPYIAQGDPHLPALRFEPEDALVSGPDGLDAIRRIVREAPVHLTAGGWLLLEHGCSQGAAVRRLLQNAGFTAVETLADLAGQPRVTLGIRPETEA